MFPYPALNIFIGNVFTIKHLPLNLQLKLFVSYDSHVYWSVSPAVVTAITASPSGRLGESTRRMILLSPLDFRR